jgi:hypothetical protein
MSYEKRDHQDERDASRRDHADAPQRLRSFTPPAGISGPEVVISRKLEFGGGWGALIASPAIDPGKPSRPAPPAQGRPCAMASNDRGTATRLTYTRGRACPSVTGPLPLRGGSTAYEVIRDGSPVGDWYGEGSPYQNGDPARWLTFLYGSRRGLPCLSVTLGGAA